VESFFEAARQMLDVEPVFSIRPAPALHVQFVAARGRRKVTAVVENGFVSTWKTPEFLACRKIMLDKHYWRKREEPILFLHLLALHGGSEMLVVIGSSFPDLIPQATRASRVF
jgi:hypothetical protein